MISRADAGALNRARSAGFTLLELIVVMVILGLVLTLIVARGPLVSRTLTLREAAGEIAAGLREARSNAIGQDRPARMTFDLARKSFQVPGRQAQRLPGAYTITLMSTAGEMRRDRDPDIRFDPDGSSTGGRVILADGARKMEIGVDWLTGRVQVINVP